MKVVLDTDVLVAALRSPRGASRAILLAVRAGRIEAVASVNMMIEYEAVLTRSEHLEAAGLTRQEVEILLDGLAELITPVTPHFLWRPRLKDPNDEMVLDAAMNARCDAIVTFNTADFEAATADFGIEILKPRELMRRLR